MVEFELSSNLKSMNLLISSVDFANFAQHILLDKEMIEKSQVFCALWLLLNCQGLFLTFLCGPEMNITQTYRIDFDLSFYMLIVFFPE